MDQNLLGLRTIIGPCLLPGDYSVQRAAPRGTAGRWRRTRSQTRTGTRTPSYLGLRVRLDPPYHGSDLQAKTGLVKSILMF